MKNVKKGGQSKSRGGRIKKIREGNLGEDLFWIFFAIFVQGATSKNQVVLLADRSAKGQTPPPTMPRPKQSVFPKSTTSGTN